MPSSREPAVVARITVGSGTVDPCVENGFAYVLNSFDGTMSQVSLKTNQQSPSGLGWSEGRGGLPERSPFARSPTTASGRCPFLGGSA